MKSEEFFGHFQFEVHHLKRKKQDKIAKYLIPELDKLNIYEPTIKSDNETPVRLDYENCTISKIINYTIVKTTSKESSNYYHAVVGGDDQLPLHIFFEYLDKQIEFIMVGFDLV